MVATGSENVSAQLLRRAIVEPKWKGASVENSLFEMLRRQTRAWNRLAPAHLRVRNVCDCNCVGGENAKVAQREATDARLS
jgi:hypothetical protein